MFYFVIALTRTFLQDVFFPSKFLLMESFQATVVSDLLLKGKCHTVVFEMVSAIKAKNCRSLYRQLSLEFLFKELRDRLKMGKTAGVFIAQEPLVPVCGIGVPILLP